MINANNPDIILKQIEYSVNLQKKIIYIEGEIETYTATFLYERIQAIKAAHDNQVDEIDLFISSPGGHVNGMTALVDIIEATDCKINTFGFGEIESAAVWILAAGTGVRHISPNTEIMVHEMSSWLRGTTSDVENEAKQLMAMQKNLYLLLEKYSNKDIAFWMKELKTNKNLYLTPELCVEYGLADKIVSPGQLK